MRENELTRIGSKLVVSIYLDSRIGRRFEMVRCIYCGHPIMETTNPVKQVVDNNGTHEGLQVGIKLICKRCKQHYRVVMHERYIEI